ncbi:pentatricopeptide repeat-containing protein At1g31790 [Cornus florida]|uniref:pentatricopeptide repeat-containing protein At1g31790 n=1 Tax=Cornus florida TaxID=4283 RepID=UPI0028A29296|nr:pentatricopeptide repeat-containing protein At1g31790 [Cornus florida]XP_059663097.1 pentatricopeptide repeat-containing protein At1g31790 [Cornus florida]
MEITYTSPKSAFYNNNHNSLNMYNNNNNIHSHNNGKKIYSTVSVNNHPLSRPSLQIQLALQQRPKRREPKYHLQKLQQLIKPSKHSSWRETTTTTTSTISDVLRLMDALGLPTPIDIYASLIKECCDTRDIASAVELHAHIDSSGIRPGLPLLNRLLLMYVSCGLIENAHQLFDKMPMKDSNSWATVIAGYAENDDYEEAINLFVEMQNRRRYHNNDDMIEFPISWIIVCILKACFHTMNLELGKQIHGWLLKVGNSTNMFLSSSLINLYGKCGCVEGADFVFDHMHRRNTVIWTAKIVNNCREGRFDEVLDDFKEMGKLRIKKNSFTFSSVLRACCRMEDDGLCGQQVHASAIKLGLESDDYVQCGVVDMYGKCGLVEDARKAFEMNEEKRNAACWNAMLTSYIHHGFCIEAIKFLYQMKAAGIQPQESLLNEVRFACGSKSPENVTDGMCPWY